MSFFKAFVSLFKQPETKTYRWKCCSCEKMNTIKVIPTPNEVRSLRPTCLHCAQENIVTAPGKGVPNSVWCRDIN